MVLLHGKGSTRSQMIARAKLLRAHGHAVLLYDARAHGRSEGRLASFGWYETRDLRGALAWLRARGFTELGCIGASQGGATIAYAAADLRGVKWVVLEATYPDLSTALDRRFQHALHLPGWLVGLAIKPLGSWRLGVPLDRLAPRLTIGQLSCPVFVMGGEADYHNPVEDTLALYRAAREPKTLWLVPNVAHKDLYGFAGAEYERRLLAFIEASASPRAAAGGPP